MSAELKRSEWRFVFVLGLLALALSSIPYVLGAALASDQRVFGGFVYAVEDCYSYLAKMRQGAEGAWLFHIAYTPEPHAGTLFFPFHLLLGKVAALLPGAPERLTERMVAVYHAARLLFGMGLLSTVYRFLAVFTPHVTVRRLAWSMVAFGGGLGWLLTGLGASGWLGSLPLDFILPEGFTFLVLFAFPHIALARTLLLSGILFLLKLWNMPYATRDTRHVLRIAYCVGIVGLSWLLMGLVVPFYVPVAWTVMGAGWAVRSLRQRRIGWRELGLSAAVGVVSAPIVIYSAVVFIQDPIYAAWGAQNRITSPRPLHYLAAFGIPLLLALFAAPPAWRERRHPAWFAVAWVAVVPLLVYLPINVQRRLVEGVQVPLSLLAAWGAVRLWNRISWRPLRGLVGLALATMPLTNLVLIVGSCLVLPARPVPIYREAAEIAALDWLAGQAAPDDVVLASYETGNYLPARVGARAFVGLGPESVNEREKREMVAHFFDAPASDVWRRSLLQDYAVDWVFWGPRERAVGGLDPNGLAYLRPAYNGAGYSVFEVVP